MALLLVTIFLFPLGYIFELLASFAVGRSHLAYQVFEFLGFAYGWTLISALVAFLLIGPFRPYNTFSLRGDCGPRAAIFFVAMIALICIFIIVALSVALSIGGRVRGV